MADERAANGKDVDPLAAFRELRDTYLDAWSKTMVDAVNTEAYAQASGTMLNTYLSASAPFREAHGEDHAAGAAATEHAFSCRFR